MGFAVGLSRLNSLEAARESRRERTITRQNSITPDPEDEDLPKVRIFFDLSAKKIMQKFRERSIFTKKCAEKSAIWQDNALIASNGVTPKGPKFEIVLFSPILVIFLI